MRRWLACLALIFGAIGHAAAATYADIDAGNIVTNIVVWDGSTTYPLPPGHLLVPYAPPAGIGSTWNGTVFSVPPVVTVVQTPSQVPATQADISALQAAVPSLAPVQSVNSQTGAVALPVYQRQVSVAVAVATADGTVNWTFPTAFTNQPTCFYSLAATSTTSTFDYPVVTALSKTAVSLTVSAHPKQISILSLTLPISLTVTPGTVPSGTTITFSCFAPT